MEKKDTVLFRESYDRCLKKTGFLDDFYDRFFNVSPVVKEMFRKTDFENQKKMLHNSLIMIMYAANNKMEGKLHLERIAQSHKHLSIHAEYYDLWLNCLVDSVKNFDPLFSEETEKAWRNTMAFGISVMKEY